MRQPSQGEVPPAPTSIAAADAAPFGIRLEPDEAWRTLRPDPEGAPGAARADVLGREFPDRSRHTTARNAMRVSLTAPPDGRPRRLNLTLTGEQGRSWQASWFQWSYAIRMVPDLFGGEAVSNQDALSTDRRVLSLLLLPGETRHAQLEFVARLDGETQPGDYRFTLTATDEDTNTLVASTVGLLRLRHPRPAYLDYLPAIYEESLIPTEISYDGHSFPADPFFNRYLSGLEQSHAPLRVLLNNLHRLYNPDETPADFLPWLATWLALTLDETWPELKRRRLIREGARLYQWRGTRRGLSEFLRIYTGVTPQIEDQPFQGMRLGPATRLGNENARLGNIAPHTFVVILSVPEGVRVSEEVVRRIIESQAPAHTTYQLRIVGA